MAALRLELSTFKPGHNREERVATPAALELPADTWPANLAVAVDVDRIGDRFNITARVATESEEDCARCLRRFRLPLDFLVHLYADRAGSGGHGEDERAEDDDLVFHDGRRVDLDQDVREAALLARPMVPLCRPDCRGLCPRCGADWNEGPCPHVPPAGTA
jgi:DUF177 domain-containing protein